MQRRLLSLLVLALAAFGAATLTAPACAQDAPAAPEGLRAVDLVQSCQNQGRHFKYAVEKQWDTTLFGQIDYVECTAYLAGIADMNAVAKGVFGASLFCLPQAGVSAEQQIEALLAWAERHPDLMNENRRAGAVSAFVQAFPCR
jgi:Rap1a immunity proteins